jgi:hypothetical protein
VGARVRGVTRRPRYARGELTLAAGALVDALGSGLFLSGLTLFLVLYAELSAGEVGSA